MAALEQGDLAGIEQHNNSLNAMAEENKEILKKVPPFKGDGRLQRATIAIMDFYIRESKTVFPKFIDFFVKKDDFERKDKRINKMKKKERTQEIIDEYNKAVVDYNNAANSFNQIIDESNKVRSKALNTYNAAVEDFFDRHN